MTTDFCPFAVQRPAPAWKQGYSWLPAATRKRGEVKHSAEGYWPGIYSRLDGSDRASWHFTVGYDRLEQHYPVSALCWHGGDVGDDGGVSANAELVGVEHLGLAGQALTETQLELTVALSRWLHETQGWPGYERGREWFEHREVSDSPTSCPSGRIPWAKLKEMLMVDSLADKQLKVIRVLQPDLTAADLDALVARLRYLFLLAGKPWPA